MDHELRWRKSSYSGGDNGECVEVAHTSGAVLVRDSKNPSGAILQVSPRAFEAFTRALR